MAANINFDTGYKCSISVQVTDKMVHQFGEMCGDMNPMHFDEEYAKTTRFGRRIAHGMIVGALFSRALNENMGEGGIYLSQSMKFLSPVYINDTVTIEMTVTAMRKEKGIATVETLAKNQNGDICVKGEAVVMIATNIQK
ncbi:MAG: MaoC family dehydratase [Bdellovibrionaceae bacterium]|nr:MaoC family dehydratase [Pseudobdellovibrionaceae bacterium]NUM57468.1 MaoC family dehydratase [Pseudobdellovibrionaceae bacterium]